jgi:hypothetical protein
MLARKTNAALVVLAAASMAMGAGAAQSQQAATPAPAAPTGPLVNDPAPDFTLNGATRYGLLKTPVTLSDYRGRTVVLAFFYQARTKG